MRLVQLGVYVDDLFSFVYLCGSDVCAVWWGYSRVASSAKLFGLYTTLYNTGCVLRFSIRVSPPAHTHIGCAAVHTHTHGLSRSLFSNSPVRSLPAGIWCWEKRWEFKWAFSSALWCSRRVTSSIRQRQWATIDTVGRLYYLDTLSTPLTQ
jgi:hypothetical protein